MRVMEPTAWVVYNMTTSSRGASTGNAVCSQSEWEAMESSQPGHHTLIRANIGNEAQAERLARDLQVPPTPAPKPKSRLMPQRPKAAEPAEPSSQEALPILS